MLDKLKEGLRNALQGAIRAHGLDRLRLEEARSDYHVDFLLNQGRYLVIPKHEREIIFREVFTGEQAGKLKPTNHLDRRSVVS